MHSSLVIKRCTRFWTQVRILILNLSFMHHIFTVFLPIAAFTFLMSSGHVVNYKQFFICHISYLYLRNYFRSSRVSNWRSRLFCCQLTPTLYHCATEDYGHVVLLNFVYLFLNLSWIFLILNRTVCNLIILGITWVQTSYIL